VNRFKSIVESCEHFGCSLQAVASCKTFQFGAALARLHSLPSPMPQPYWPWVRRLNPKLLVEFKGLERRMAMEFGDRSCEIDPEWVRRPLADYGGKKVLGAFTRLTLHELPKQDVSLATTVQFSGSAEYDCAPFSRRLPTKSHASKRRP
jgi:hypothetical protein